MQPLPGGLPGKFTLKQVPARTPDAIAKERTGKEARYGVAEKAVALSASSRSFPRDRRKAFGTQCSRNYRNSGGPGFQNLDSRTTAGQDGYYRDLGAGQLSDWVIHRAGQLDARVATDDFRNTLRVLTDQPPYAVRASDRAESGQILRRK